MNAVYSVICLLLTLSIVGCGSEHKKAQMGAGAGAAAGAVVGAVLGHQTGNRDKGAFWGAAVGGLIGGAMGHKLDKQAKELEKIAETKRTENGIVTKLKGDILFTTGKAGLNGQAQSSISEITKIVKKYPENRITVIGHTDSTGSNQVNKTLSEKRAQSVQSLMVAQGFPPNHIRSIGAGEEQPVADNSTANGRQLNRRVELQIVMVETPKKKK